MHQAWTIGLVADPMYRRLPSLACQGQTECLFWASRTIPCPVRTLHEGILPPLHTAGLAWKADGPHCTGWA